MPTTITPASQSIGEITAALRLVIPNTHPEFFKVRMQGSETITYIPWHRVREALDQFAPGWELSIKEVGSVTGDIPAQTDTQGNVRRPARPHFTRVYVVIVLSIPTCDGRVQRMATGYEDFDKDGYGDPFSNASAMALGRAAAMFGLGIDLYDKDKRAQIGAGGGGYQSSTVPQQTQAPADGVPRARHGAHKDKPITDPSIDLGWLQFMSDPAKAERVNATDRAVYQAELARRQAGGVVPAGVMTNPPASYNPSPAPGAVVPPATASPSNGGTPRSNDEIKVLFEAGKAAGQEWAAIQARAVTEFGRAPKELTVGEFGALTLMVGRSKTKADIIALAGQHLAGNPDPRGWGSSELALLGAMI